MARQMLINSLTGQECRIVTQNDSVMEELYVERASNASRVGNIYKGRVTNIEPSIQAAFIDFGLYKNGFLHISDLTSEYFPKGKGKVSGGEGVGRKTAHRDRPPIQECLKRGQEVVVQMTKEGIGTKGPTMTTYLSIPGRLLVMMPGMKRLGVSRKVEDDEIRAKAKEALSQLKLPTDMGFIVRTAGVDRPKREMQRDLNYLLRLWKSTSKLIKTEKAPVEIYRESDLIIRTLRDAYDTDISRIVCDNAEVAVKVRDFLKVATPRTKTKIEVYTGSGGLFHDMGLDEEIDKINARRVELPSGGSLVIDPTEALVAIDVNSGRSRGHSDAEATALNTNLEAARAIGRQMRMRDLGGLVVMDFIDMRSEKNRRAVEKELKDVMKGDRAKSRVLRINSFGILQMTRQRLGPPLKNSYYNSCPHCDGLGMVKSDESQALVAMRLLAQASGNPDISKINIVCPPPVAHYLNNSQRKDIILIEEQTKKRIIITADSDMTGDDVRLECTNARGSKVASEGKHNRKKLNTVSLDSYLNQKPGETDLTDELEESKPDKPKKSRRRRRSKSSKKTEEQADAVETKTDEEASDQPEEKTDEQPEKPAKSSRRRRRSGAKQTSKKTGDEEASDEKTEEKSEEKTDEKTGDAPEKPAKPSRRRRRSGSKRTSEKTGSEDTNGEKTEEKSEEKTDEKTGDTSEKPAKPSRRRRRSSSKRTSEKKDTDDKAKSESEDKDKGEKDAAKKPPRKKAAKRAKKSASAKPDKTTRSIDDDQPIVTPPSKLREEFEAEILKAQKDKPPKKTLLEAMGFDDGE
ncbi:MAG: Rne/Rng family ribonuclease [Phycisphaerales bacterium]|nr:Rne/Rng family ribonuclease [Phycisphaerales bacterium]